MSISILLSMVDEVNRWKFHRLNDCRAYSKPYPHPPPLATNPSVPKTLFVPASAKSQNCMRDVGLNEKRWGEERNDGGKVESHHNFFCVFWVTATECHIIGPKGPHYHHHHLHIQHQKGETIWFLSQRWDTSLEVMENVQTAKQAFITKVF